MTRFMSYGIIMAVNIVYIYMSIYPNDMVREILTKRNIKHNIYVMANL